MEMHRAILRTDGLNCLTFSDPSARLCFTRILVKSALSEQQLKSRYQDRNMKIEKKKVIYLDCDTMFTAYLRAGFLFDLGQQGEKWNYDVTAEDKIIADKTGLSLLENENDGYNSKSTKENIIEIKRESRRLIDIYLPSQGRFESILGDITSSMPKASVVIFDSINSFYNMYPIQMSQSTSRLSQSTKNQKQTARKIQKEDGAVPLWKQDCTSPTEVEEKTKGQSIGRLNHLLSIFIMLLVKHGVYLNIPVLVTSMVRYKKVSGDLWIKSPACRRLLHQKSVVRLSVEMSGEKDLSVNIMKHPSVPQQTILFPNAAISLDI